MLTPSACEEAHSNSDQCGHAAGDAQRAACRCGTWLGHAEACAAMCERAGEDGAHRLGKCGAVRRSAWVHGTRKLSQHQGHAAAPFGGARATVLESRRSASGKVGFSEVLLRLPVYTKELKGFDR